MKNSIQIGVLLCAFCLCISCNKVHLLANKKNPLDLPHDNAWSDTLKSRSAEIEKAAFKSIRLTSISGWRELRPEIPQAEAEMKELNFVLVNSYCIDSASFANLKKTTNLESIISIDKYRSNYFITRKEQFLFHGMYNLKSKRWLETTLLIKSAADSLFAVFYEKKLPVFFVNVDVGIQFGCIPCIVYVEGGIIKKIGNGGAGEPLKDYLLNLKGIETSE
jgi:hypothetical protein